MSIVLLVLLGGAPATEVIQRWPDGGVRQTRSTVDGGVIETIYFTTGQRWIEVSGGVKRTYEPEGWLQETSTLNRFGNADGPVRRFQIDGGLIATGSYANGAQTGAWTTWWDNGNREAERVFSPTGEVLTEVKWTSEGWKQSERKDGEAREFLPDGGLSSLRTRTGRIDTYRGGRLVQQQQSTREGLLLINAWGADGGQEIRDGSGSRMEIDGELGTPFRVKYGGGKPVR